MEGKTGDEGGSLVPEAESPVNADRLGRFARSVDGFAIPGVAARVGRINLFVGSGTLNRELLAPALAASFLFSDRISASKATRCSFWRLYAPSKQPTFHSRSRARFFSHSISARSLRISAFFAATLSSPKRNATTTKTKRIPTIHMTTMLGFTVLVGVPKRGSKRVRCCKDVRELCPWDLA